MRTDEQHLREVYNNLRAQRQQQSSTPPDIPVEVVHALATGGPVAGNREDLMDAVLRDEWTARELRFFMDLPHERPLTTTWFRSIPKLALAAGLLLAVGFGLRTLVRPSPTPDVMRGDADSVRLTSPDASARSSASTTLTWRSVSPGASYLLEVTDQEGSVVFTTTGADTTAATVLPIGSFLWSVTATREDGTTLRSELRPLIVEKR